MGVVSFGVEGKFLNDAKTLGLPRSLTTDNGGVTSIKFGVWRRPNKNMLKRLWDWLFHYAPPPPKHKHAWRCVNVWTYVDVSYGGKAPSACITLVCKCGDVTTKHLYACGDITVDQINAANEVAELESML